MVTNVKTANRQTRRIAAKKRNTRTRDTRNDAFFELQRQQICDAAARIIYEDGIRDYHKAKLRACESLHIKANTYLPTNQEIEQAVHRRIELFESDRHGVSATNSSQAQLRTAKDLLTILDSYQARVTQALATSIRLKNSPIEIHVFADAAELVSDELQWRGIPCFTVEKRYRYSNSQYVNVPLIICHLDECEIEISVFGEKELHRSPVCPTNGKLYQRISLKQLELQFPS